MPNLAQRLTETAAAVATIGATTLEIFALGDNELLAGMTRVRDHRRALQAYEVALAAEVVRRSHHELGYAGLARRNGAATPAVLIQTLLGVSTGEAHRLAGLGRAVNDATAEPELPSHPIVAATFEGAVSVDAADAIRRGLGEPDEAVTAEQLRGAAQELLATANAVTPEILLRTARQLRSELDLDAVARGEKHRNELRYVRTYRRDGMSGGSWQLPDEDGGLEIHNALKQFIAGRTGGPRFPSFSAPEDDTTKTAAELALGDTRTNEQILADAFTQILHNGIAADPAVLPAAQRAAVRVIATAETIETGSGTGILEDSLSGITLAKVEEFLCEGGTIGVVFDQHGELLDYGRERRLFTRRQRAALAVRDGGCRHPGCDKPPSWCEAHHIKHWARDRGKTNIANGILLCRYHHMLIHNNGWAIVPDTGTHWLVPPSDIDPQRTPLEMPTRNPLVAAIRHGGTAS